MKYFEKHLKATDSADDIDISVHCDIKIFEWLMNYLNNCAPKLEPSTVIPILISADFLVMKSLINEWTQFIAKNISEIVKIPIDMSCLSQQIIKNIASWLTLEELDSCKDPRDSLQSKLFSHKLEELLKKDENKLSRWIYCNTLYTEQQNEWMSWPKADIFIDYRGRVLAKHVPDSNWDINEFFSYLKKHGVSWRRIFWKVWGRLVDDECTVWNHRYVLAEVENCAYHPEKPQFYYGWNTGSFPCCEAEAVRFTTSFITTGCKSKRHTFTKTKEDSLEYRYLNSHLDILKEPIVNETSFKMDQGQELKIELPSDNAAKETSPKLKLLSLLTLVKDFVANKYLKLRNTNCLDCAQLGTCWSKCLLEQDEDDGNETDFSFVLPKNLKPTIRSKSTLSQLVKLLSLVEDKYFLYRHRQERRWR